MVKMTIGARMQELWDKFGGIDRKMGDVFRVSRSEQIRKKYRGRLYRLYAYSRWLMPAKRAAMEVEKTTGAKVIISPVESKRFRGGQYIQYGIWVKEGKG